MKFLSFVLVLFLLVTVYGKIRKVKTSLNTESAKTREALEESAEAKSSDIFSKVPGLPNSFKLTLKLKILKNLI